MDILVANNKLYLFAIVGKEIYLGHRAFVGSKLASQEYQIAPQYSDHESITCQGKPIRNLIHVLERLIFWQKSHAILGRTFDVFMSNPNHVFMIIS